MIYIDNKLNIIMSSNFVYLPPEIWEKIIGEYGLLNRKYIDTIKMIPSRHNIMEPLYKLLQQYINYLCNLCHSIKSRKVKYTNNIITSQAIINTPYIFNKQNDAYTAICGDTQSPCNLNIKIYNGYYNDLETLLYGMKDEFDDSKNAIIIQKIKTIFNYLSDSQSANLFKKELSNYNDISSLYKIVLDVYDQIYNNMHKKELIIRKNAEIYELLENIKIVLNEYTTTNNIELLKTAVQMQHDDLIPKIEFLRRLKYEIMEMNSDKNGMIHLIQNPVPLSKIVYSYDEPSNIVKFTK